MSIVIGITGGSGSGKTFFAQKLSRRLGGVSIIECDSYYKDLKGLSIIERNNMNFDHPNALDIKLLIEHILMLKSGKNILKPVYDFKQHSRLKEAIEVLPDDIVIVEGILLFVDEQLRKLLDLKVFIDTPGDIRFDRRMKRDIEERGRTQQSCIDQYEKTVRPMYLKFVEISRQYADVVMDGTENIEKEMKFFLELLKNLRSM